LQYFTNRVIADFILCLRFERNWCTSTAVDLERSHSEQSVADAVFHMPPKCGVEVY